MADRIDIGIASYGNPQKLQATIESLRANTVSDWRCFIISNPHPDAGIEAMTRAVIDTQAVTDRRIVPIDMPDNRGYCGAVNALFDAAETEFVGYMDNDVEIRTPGWDRIMLSILQQNSDCGWIFPGSGHYPHNNGRYQECLWNAGYFWMLRSEARKKLAARESAMFNPDYMRAGYMDSKLGHHEEVDLMIRLRLAGFTTACAPSVNVLHHETATRADSADHKPGGRIHDGVVRWMNKWNRYFCGDQLQYAMDKYDPKALRYTDWNVDALYLERAVLSWFPGWNSAPETVNVSGVGPMDAVKVLKPKGCYVGRAI